TKLSEPIHQVGPCERLRKEEHFGILIPNFADNPFPERKRLCMRIIDAEDPHALFDPKKEDALQFLPELSPIRSLKIQGINVLILFGWILRILNRAVRACAEPFPMLLHVGMIGAALERDIERNFQAVIGRFRDESSKILQGSQVWVNRLVTTFR